MQREIASDAFNYLLIVLCKAASSKSPLILSIWPSMCVKEMMEAELASS